MKKLWMLSLVSAVICMAFTGCGKKDMYDPDRPEEDARAVYERNFLAYVGGSIDSRVDWGFGKAARTRSMTRAEAPTVELSSSVTTEFSKTFLNTVKDYFPADGVCKSSDWLSYEFKETGDYFNVRLIYTNTTKHDEIGIYYYDPETETIEDFQTVKMISDIQENVEKYYQYNQYSTGRLWENPISTSGYDVWDKAERIRAYTFTIRMKAKYRFGFYIKDANGSKTYYSNMNLNDQDTEYSGGLIGDVPVGTVKQSYIFGLSDDGKPGCNILLAIIKAGKDGHFPELVEPEKPEPPTPPTPPEPKLDWYRIIAEDLNAHDSDRDGAHDDTDFDFNDVVLDVALTDDGAKCILQAAGATLKIRINGDNNLEVHDLFGVKQQTMVNTHADKKGLANADLPPVEFSLKGSFSSIDNIKLEVYKQDGWMELKAPAGQASCKIAVGTTFVWPDERESLKEKYPDFLNYVKYYENVDSWWEKMTK